MRVSPFVGGRLGWVVFVAVVGMVLLAGCSASPQLGGSSPEPGSPGVPTASAGTTHQSDSAGSPTAGRGTTVSSQFTVRSPASDTASTRVVVTEVVDGDTVQIAYQNGSTDTVRLLGIDAPEIRADNDPREFEGIPDTKAGETCLRDAGQNATAYLVAALEGKQVSLVFDAQADRRGYYDRLLAYVYVNGSNVNHRLVVRGHARVYESEFTVKDRFYSAESRAQLAYRNLWQCARLS